MRNNVNKISPRTSLISAVLVHASVEIPYFIFPVIVIVVGNDLDFFMTLGSFKWIALGLIGTAASLAIALPSPAFGWLADRYRRGAMMFYSLIIEACGALIIGLFGNSFVALLTGTVLTGVGVSLYHPPGLSWVSSAYENPVEESYSQKFSGVLGIHGMGGTIGAAIAPLSVYLLIETFNWRYIYLLWVFPLLGLSLVFWLFIGRFEPENGDSVSTSSKKQIIPTNEKRNLLGRNTSILSVFIFLFAISLVLGMISFILSPFLTEVKNLRISEAAFFIGLSTLLGASGQLIGGFLGDKYGEKITLVLSTSFQVICLITIYIMTTYSVLLLFYILLSMTFSIFWPITSSLLAKLSSRRGSAFGWFMMTTNIVRALGPGIAGLLIIVDAQEYFLIFFFAILLSLVALLSILFSLTNKTLPDI
ncbi:MAG: MFS transporter [Candidatus Hermodarchaeota archaeon]